jgi:prepilin-type N-terminal cleavage/methylation domain-containing protein
MNSSKGFTLIEMMVSIAIFSIITSVVIFNHGKFNSSINVTNLSYEVALAIRQAQVYGLAVKQDADRVDESVEYAYGVYFDTSSAASKKVFYIFADEDDNQQFDPSGDLCDGTGECQELIEIRGDVEVGSLSTNTVSGSESLTVLFLRPNPVAIIRDESNSGASSSGRNQAVITLTSAKADKSKEIVIELSGQISVRDSI